MSRCKFYEKTIVDNINQLDFLDTQLNDFIVKNPIGYYTVTQSDIGRIDRISYALYGNSAFWWVLCLHNNISDPFSELSIGQVLEVPNIEDIYELYRSKKLR